MEWLYAVDRSLFEVVHGWRSSALDVVFVAFTDAGLGEVQAAALLGVAALRKWPGWQGRRVALLLAAVVLGVGLLKNDLPYYTLGLALTWLFVAPFSSVEAMRAVGVAAAAGVIRLGIMVWADRLRPSNFAFAEPLEHVYGASSFPSGHSTTAFAIAFAALIATWGGSRWWVGQAALLYAVMIGLSRVYVGVHYPTDIVAGAGLALAVASGAAIISAHRASSRLAAEPADAGRKQVS